MSIAIPGQTSIFDSASTSSLSAAVQDVRSNGAIPDCKRLTDVVATSGSAIISSATAAWTLADVGKVINLYDFTNQKYIARTTILSFQSATQVTMNATASANLLAANCIGYYGTDNSTAIQAAINAAAANLLPISQGPNLALGGGNSEVIFPADSRGNMYLFGSQLTVPTNVLLNAEAMLVSTVGLGNNDTNGQANRTFAIVFNSGAGVLGRLQMFLNYTMGVKFGTNAAQTHTFINAITLWDTGANFNAGASPTSQVSCQLNGNDYYIGSFWQKNGNNGLYLNGANDVMIGHCFTIGSGTGLTINTCEEVQIDMIQVDTCSFTGVSIEAVRTARLTGHVFSINATTCTAAIGIGQFDTTQNRGLTLDFSFNRHGGDSIRVGPILDSRIIANCSNAALAGAGGVAIANAINFTGAAGPLSGTLLIDLTCDSAITPSTGTSFGCFIMNGYPYYSVQAPTTGFTITIANGNQSLILNPAGTLASGTINMPASPVDGMEVSISSSQIVTALTHNGNGGTLKNGLTTIAAGGAAKWKYQKSATTWFRIQ